MATKRPQLSLDELRQLKWFLGGALALLSIAAVAYLEVDTWAFVAVACLGILAGLIWPSLPSRIPVLAHRLAFPAIVAVFLTDLWITGELLPAVVRLDLCLLLYRGITYRIRRDDLQILILGLFLIVVAGVITVSLVFAAQLLVFTALALIFLLAVTVVDATQAVEPPVPPGTLPQWAASVRWLNLARRVRQVTDWRVAVLGALLFAGVVAISAVLFMAIPRFQIGDALFLDRLVARRARTGFNDTIRFGEISQIAQDDSVAMNIDVADPSRVPALPYWRMLILDDYRDQTFRLSPALRLLQFSRLRADMAVAGIERTKETQVWTFYVEAGVSRYLPLLGRFSAIRFRETQYYQSANELSVIALRDEPSTMTAYRVEGMVESDRLSDTRFAYRLRSRPQTSEAALYESLHISGADKAVLHRVEQSIVPGAPGSAADFSSKVNAWLANTHGYSLDPVIPAGAGDPLVRWIDSKSVGHCELFSGAFVLLARSAGFPARVVTGFKGGTWNAYSNNFTVRNSDAHAWAEIWDAQSDSWIREDPLERGTVAAQTATQEASAGGRADRSWAARLNSLRVFWYRRIVNFDQATQIETAKAVRDAAESSGKAIRDWFSSLGLQVRNLFVTPWNPQRIREVGIGVAGLALIGWLVRLLVGVFQRADRRKRGLDPARLEAGRWLRRLGECDDPVLASLRRIRFGRKESWPKPDGVFREARRAAKRTRARSP